MHGTVFQSTWFNSAEKQIDIDTAFVMYICQSISLRSCRYRRHRRLNMVSYSCFYMQIDFDSILLISMIST